MLFRSEQGEALDVFRDMVNSTFAACGMRKWNPMYELDALLAACYQEDEMFYFGELCDAVNKAQEQVLTAGHAM